MTKTQKIQAACSAFETAAQARVNAVPGTSQYTDRAALCAREDEALAALRTACVTAGMDHDTFGGEKYIAKFGTVSLRTQGSYPSATFTNATEIASAKKKSAIRNAVRRDMGAY